MKGRVVDDVHVLREVRQMRRYFQAVGQTGALPGVRRRE